MKTHVDYANEVVRDAMNGVEPNPSVAQRAIADANSLRAVNAELVTALQYFAAVPCEYRGNIHCTMMPPESNHKTCGPCAARAALAKAGAQS